MRTGITTSSYQVPSSPSTLSTLHEWIASFDASVLRSAGRRWGLQLPPWLGGKVDPRIQELSWMLRALKSAGESFLEASISNANVVLPFPVPADTFRLLRSTASSVALSGPVLHQYPAGVLAAYASGIRGRWMGSCDAFSSPGDDPEELVQVILTIQYTRAALTAILFYEECTIFDDVRVLHRTDLGQNSLTTSPNSRDQLVSALRNITSFPMAVGDYLKLDRLNHVVLHGEAANDGLLHEALKETLAGLHMKPALVTGGNSVDPLFAASRGLAWDCWERSRVTVSAEL
jgi:hypothetical protein